MIQFSTIKLEKYCAGRLSIYVGFLSWNCHWFNYIVLVSYVDVEIFMDLVSLCQLQI